MEARTRLGQADLEGVAVEGADAFDLAVVVELAGGLRFLAQRCHAERPARFDRRRSAGSSSADRTTRLNWYT